MRQKNKIDEQIDEYIRDDKTSIVKKDAFGVGSSGSGGPNRQVFFKNFSGGLNKLAHSYHEIQIRKKRERMKYRYA